MAEMPLIIAPFSSRLTLHVDARNNLFSILQIIGCHCSSAFLRCIALEFLDDPTTSPSLWLIALLAIHHGGNQV